MFHLLSFLSKQLLIRRGGQRTPIMKRREPWRPALEELERRDCPSVTLSFPGDPLNMAGDAVSLSVTGSTSDSSSLTYGETGMPSGLSFNTATGAFSGNIADTAASSTVYAVTVTGTSTSAGSSQVIFDWTVNPPNASMSFPGDQISLAGSSVDIDVTGSSSDGNSLTYSETGLPAGLSLNSSTGEITGSIPTDISSAAVDAVTVTGTDTSSGVVAATTFHWTINPPNVLMGFPGDQSSGAGNAIDITVTGSSTNGDSLTYGASGLPSGLSLDASTGEITGTIPTDISSAAVYAVTITGTDPSSGLSAATTFHWTVNPPNVVMGFPGDQTSDAGSAIDTYVAGTSTNGDSVTYSASGLPSVLSLDASTGEITGTIPSDISSAAVYAVTITGTDPSSGLSAATTFHWTINPSGTAGTVGTVTMNPPGDQLSHNGDAVAPNVTGSSSDEGSLTYSAAGLPSFLSIDSATGEISGTVPTDASSAVYSVTVTGTDSISGDAASTTFAWTIDPPNVTMNPPGNQLSHNGDAVAPNVTGTSSNGDSLTYSATALPAFLSIDSATGTISGTVPTDAANAVYTVTVTGTDDPSGAAASTTFDWTVDLPNVTMNPPGNQLSHNGDSVAPNVTGTSSNGDSLTYSATGLPSFLSIDSATGAISGTVPNDASNADYTVAVTGTDDPSGVAGTTTFYWTIDPPSVTMIFPDDQSSYAGDSPGLNVTGSSSDAYALTYSETGLPSGLSINSATGAISGTIADTADAAIYAVTVTGTDTSSGVGANTGFYWTVNPSVVSLTSPGDQANFDGDTVSLSLSATTRTGNPLTFSESGLPSGLSIDSGTGAISGTISSGADTSSPYSVTITASDAGSSGTQTFNWYIGPVSVYVFGPGDQTNAVGDTPDVTNVAFDTAAQPLTFSATGLPDGLAVDPTTGAFTGTIASDAASGTEYAVTVTATDSVAAVQGTATFNWTVSQLLLLNPGAQWNFPGDSVDLSLYTDGATSGATFSAANLPSGLTIDATTGAITGTIASGAAAGSPYSVTVTVSTGSASASQAFTWTVQAIYLNAPPQQANETGDSVSLSLSANVPNGDDVTYSATGLPDGLSIDSTSGLITGTISTSATTNTVAFTPTVTVTDAVTGATASTTFNWSVFPVPATGTVQYYPLVGGFVLGQGQTLPQFEVTSSLDVRANGLTWTFRWLLNPAGTAWSPQTFASIGPTSRWYNVQLGALPAGADTVGLPTGWGWYQPNRSSPLVLYVPNAAPFNNPPQLPRAAQPQFGQPRPAPQQAQIEAALAAALQANRAYQVANRQIQEAIRDRDQAIRQLATLDLGPADPRLPALRQQRDIAQLIINAFTPTRDTLWNALQLALDNLERVRSE